VDNDVIFSLLIETGIFRAAFQTMKMLQIRLVVLAILSTVESIQHINASCAAITCEQGYFCQYGACVLTNRTSSNADGGNATNSSSACDYVNCEYNPGYKCVNGECVFTGCIIACPGHMTRGTDVDGSSCTCVPDGLYHLPFFAKIVIAVIVLVGCILAYFYLLLYNYINMQCFIILIDGIKMERNRCLSGRITNNEGITLIVGRKIFCVSQTYTC